MSSLSRFLSRTFSTAAAEPAKTSIVKSIPDSILEEPNLKKVVELFKKSSESGRFRKNIGVYRSTVRRLAAVKRFRCIEEILEEQKKYRDITNEGFAVRLISLYGESGMFDQAWKVFDELPELKCDRTVQSFNALLGACVKSKKFDKVEDFFRDLPKKLDVNPNVISYNFRANSDCQRFRANSGIYKSTVRRLAAEDQFRSIEDILEHQKKYIDITREGFAARLISLYGKSVMFDHASKLFDELPELKCNRTVKSFNALLGACVNSKKFDKLDGYFRELPEKLGVKPDMVSYTMMIKAYCEMCSLELDAAVSSLDEMEKKGLEPDLVTFNILLHAFYEKNKNRFEDGDELWNRMKKKDIVPDIRSYNAKLVRLVSEKRFSEANELLNDMEANEIKADAFSYTALVKGYSEDGNIEEVKKWYGEFSRNGCIPMRSTFATIVPFAREKGDLGWAFELCKESVERRCFLDVNELQRVVDAFVHHFGFG